MLLLKNSSPRRWGADFLQYCRSLQQSRASFHRFGGSKSIVFHLFFNTFANWTIFVGVVRRSHGRSLKNSKLKKNACHCSAALFFHSTPRKFLTFFFIFSSCVSLFHLFNAFTSPQEGPGGGARGAPRPDDFISQKHAPCLSRKQNPVLLGAAGSC